MNEFEEFKNYLSKAKEIYSTSFSEKEAQEADEFLKSIENYKPETFWEMGRFLQIRGNGSAINCNIFYNLAFYCYKTAAELLYPNAVRSVGQCYMLGVGVGIDQKVAIEYFNKAAELGNNFAKIDLGLCYLFGDGVDKNLKVAHFWLDQAAKSGDGYAMAQLGSYYEKIGDYQSAFKWRSKSAEAGSALGILGLGKLYILGHGVGKDFNTGWNLIIKAAELGESGAQYFIGRAYVVGDYENVKIDYNLGLKWLNEAVENGDYNAMTLYGQLLIEGTITVQDIDKGFEYLFIAARHDDADAKSVLTYLYSRCEDSLKDYDKAFYWAERAAQTDDGDLIMLLALCYENGIGTTHNREKAYELYKRCADLGSIEAKYKLDAESI